MSIACGFEHAGVPLRGSLLDALGGEERHVRRLDKPARLERYASEAEL